MPQNNKSIIDERRKRVAELYLQGKWQTEIAKIVKVTQAQISKDLTVLRRLWRQSALIDIDKIKAKELAKLDRLENEYWIAWENSKRDTVRTIQKNVTGEYEHEESSEINTTTSGDPRYLQGILSCISKRCEIFGINAPFKLDTTTKGESTRPMNIIVDSSETSEVLKKIINGTKADTDLP